MFLACKELNKSLILQILMTSQEGGTSLIMFYSERERETERDRERGRERERERERETES
jgi:hypothetical protein